MRALPKLHVEGPADRFFILSLLKTHGIELRKVAGPVVIDEAGGDVPLLTRMKQAKFSTEGPVGFVVDIDKSLSSRWDSVRGRLQPLNVRLPTTPRKEGFVAYSEVIKGNVGVWMMPDNTTDHGKLEDLLLMSVHRPNPVLELARHSTAKAVRKGAKFPKSDTIKAQTYCWLAWQREPGKALEDAVKSRSLFDHHHGSAILFVQWFRELFKAELAYAVPASE